MSLCPVGIQAGEIAMALMAGTPDVGESTRWIRSVFELRGIRLRE